ncbi:Sigma54 specific transcriptional regulator, Fis family (modular protein) [uncultured Desulfobacterium sp.]|uniref:Sigma54 specific transcriptional regulator, Fis family (Modular protein) n=1 Tax=uncultured Desulfobacterium sp. TaxID=201089 RepID=A0A445N326_9BACT|nr:Sigma54 specific transcriptional regulator, Fis family (modular protein) [uncultured Desulfobacterium sp.]
MNSNLNILIIQSPTVVFSKLESRIKDAGFSLWCTATQDTPIGQLEALNPQLAIIGPSLNNDEVLRCIHALKIVNPAMPVLTSRKEICVPGGLSAAPFDGIHYLSLEPSSDEISKAIEMSLKHKAESTLRPNFQVVIGQGRECMAIRQKIQNVSDKDITVLITGETGTGKELIARSIHFHSLRNKGPLVKINCGALPDDLLESEVFGFQRGAFTDAHRDKPGRLEMAHGGTLFIDEIGNLSLSLQVKFLQVLEEKTFTRLGGTEDKIINTRVVAATNSDLHELVRKGAFRKDLFYRLNIVNITAPPLRDRRDDIPLLVHYFINRYCFEFKKEPLEMPDHILNLFMEYHWPGNIRELENVIRLAVILRDWNFAFKELNINNIKQKKGAVGPPQPLPPQLSWDDEKIQRTFNERGFSLKKVSKTYVSEAEKKAILDMLRQTQWNRKKAARLLRISYKTLLNRIEEFDLKP